MRCVDPQVGERALRLQDQWRLECDFAHRVARVLFDVEAELGRDARVISGFRTRREQDALRARGRPAAPDHLSTHRTYPATGADISIGMVPTDTQKAIFGRIVVFNGLRWGGGSPVDPQTGIPSDWNHVDTGPRSG